jgi:hypothetical protein
MTPSGHSLLILLIFVAVNDKIRLVEQSHILDGNLRSDIENSPLQCLNANRSNNNANVLVLKWKIDSIINNF